MYFGPGISVGRRGISYGDSDAQAFISATGLTGATEVNAVTNLVANLKTYGLWSKMKAIYPFVSDTNNLLSYSQDFTNAYWSKNTTLTANATTAPDGTNTATQTSGAGNIYTLGPTLSAQQYTLSVYAKANTATSFELVLGTAGYALGFKCAFNLSNGTAGAVTNYGGLSGTASISNAGNGWYRCTISGVVTAAQYYIQLNTNANAFYIWGSQLELGSTATTYQPIATTPANRFVSQFKYNLKDPRDLDAAFRLAFNGTWAYSKQGALPNGTNAFADTKLNPTTLGFTQTDTHISAYLRTDSNGAKVDIGGSYNLFMGVRWANNYNYPINRSNNANGTSSDSLGYFLASRVDNVRDRMFKNGTNVTNFTGAAVSLDNNTIMISATNGGGLYSDRQTSFNTIGYGLTDTEATNLYTSVQQFNQDLSRQVGVPIVSDADAQSFLNAAQITDLTQANAINTLVVGLKNASLWTKMKAIYPFVGGTATTHKWNLKDPRDLDAAYRLAFYGSWTHSSSGITGNGISTYAVTYLNPSINLPSSQNSSIYIRTYATGGSSYPKQFAAQASPRFNYLGGLNHLESYMGANTTVINDGTNTIGYFSAGGDNTLVYRKYRNNARITKADVYLGANTNMNIGDSQANFTTACNISFFNIGDSLTDSEISSVYNLVQNFQTTLGRQV